MTASDAPSYVARSFRSLFSSTTPCARCHTRGGDADSRSKSKEPRRVDGSRFGVNGSVCAACYSALLRAAKGGPVPRIFALDMEWPEDNREACDMIREMWDSPSRIMILPPDDGWIED